jgi:hypothetical protein
VTKTLLSPMKSRAGMAAAWFALVAIAVIGRLWQPTWQGQPLWNVTPMAAVALASGAIFGRPAMAASVPLAAIMMSNLALPAYGSWPMAMVVFGATAWPVLLGHVVRSGRWTAILGGSLASSLVFFLTTNFACWALADMYPHTVSGLGECFVAALPFYRWMPVGDLVWTVVIFGAMQVVAARASAASRLTAQETT